MATYTSVADANGDFTVPFSANYTSGQKITVTSEKSGAVKSIELFAPSNTSGGGFIEISGDYSNFPQHIGVITISDELGTRLNNNSFFSDSVYTNIFGVATGLVIPSVIINIGEFCFSGWVNSLSLNIGGVIENIPQYSFSSWRSIQNAVFPEGTKYFRQYSLVSWTSLKTIVLPSTTEVIESYAMSDWSSAQAITLLSTSPPAISHTSFNGLRSACIFKVPATSVDAYQNAPYWSAFAARIQAI